MIGNPVEKVDEKSGHEESKALWRAGTMTFRKELKTSRNFCQSGNLGVGGPGGWEALLGNPQARAHICYGHENISRRSENICHKYKNIFDKMRTFTNE